MGDQRFRYYVTVLLYRTTKKKKASFPICRIWLCIEVSLRRFETLTLFRTKNQVTKILPLFKTKDKLLAVLFWGHLLAIAIDKIHVIVIALKKKFLTRINLIVQTIPRLARNYIPCLGQTRALNYIPCLGEKGQKPYPVQRHIPV